MIGDVIFSLLSNDVDVAAIVGTKIYQDLAIEDIVYPYIVIDQVNNDPTDCKDGASTLDTLEYDIEIYTKTRDQSTDLGVKVRLALDRYSGTVNSKVIQSVKYNNENSDYDDSDGRVYLKVQSYSFRYLNPLT